MPRIDASPRVRDFISRQAPEPRQLLRDGLRRLEREEGNIKALQGELEGYYRFRVGGFRFIFQYNIEASERVIRCLLVERRALVYQVLTDFVNNRLRERTQPSAPLPKPHPVRYSKSKRRLPVKPKRKPPAKPRQRAK